MQIRKSFLPLFFCLTISVLPAALYGEHGDAQPAASAKGVAKKPAPPSIPCTLAYFVYPRLKTLPPRGCDGLDETTNYVEGGACPNEDLKCATPKTLKVLDNDTAHLCYKFEGTRHTVASVCVPR